MVAVEPGSGYVTELVDDTPAMLLGQRDDWRLCRWVEEEAQEDTGVSSGIILDKGKEEGILTKILDPVIHCCCSGFCQSRALAGGEVEEGARCVSSAPRNPAHTSLMVRPVATEPASSVSST